MRSITRSLGLFAPLLIVVGVAVGVVLSILHAPVVLVMLAIATAVCCVAGVVAAVVVGVREPRAAGAGAEAGVRRAVAWVVREPESAEARRELASRLGQFDDIRRVADQLLERHRDVVRRALREVGAAAVLESASSGSRWERVAAARNIAWLAPSDATVRLDLLARDPDVDVALAGASALATVPAADAYRALVRLLADGPLPASRTASIIEESVYPEPVTVLLQEVPGGPTPVRYWGAYLAGRALDPRAFELLATLAWDDDANVRANAAEAMGGVRASDGVKLLERLSHDDVWYVRAHAARALADGGAHGAARLTALLADENWWVRESAANALTAIGPAAIPALREVLRSSDRFARNKAGEVLVGLGFVEREMATLFANNGQREHARESLVLLGRAEVLASLTTRFLLVAEERRDELAAVLADIGDPRLAPTRRMLLGGRESAMEAAS